MFAEQCPRSTVSQAILNAHAKITTIEEVYNKPLSNWKIPSLLEHREDFWILKLQTLCPQCRNISLNYRQDTTGSIWWTY